MTDDEFWTALDYHDTWMRYWFAQAREAFAELESLSDQEEQIDSDR